jgi:hypothetical protein
VAVSSIIQIFLLLTLHSRKPYVQTNLEGVLYSNLHPYDNSNSVLVRWSIIPVFKSSSTNSSNPDGALIYGDIINGKIPFNELIVTEFEDGYAGTYFLDSNSSQFILLSAVRWSKGQLILDEALPNAVDTIKAAQSSLLSATKEGTFNAAPYEITADRFELSTYVSCTGEEVPLLEADYNPPLFQVRATSNTYWVSLRQKQLAIQVTSVVVQIISSILISWLLFLPIYRFVQTVEKDLGKTTYAASKRAGVKDVIGKFSSALKSGNSRNKSTAKESDNIASSVA